jgi:alpha-L-fucosidase
MKKISLSIVLLFFISILFAQQASITIEHKTEKKVLDEFMAMRFGMFIHWGPVTLKGTEIGWSRSHEVPAEVYDTLYRAFNPLHFDAEAWVKTAKKAGMKYLTITSRHHDGFCLWPSDFTDYDIAASPFGRDILKELTEACNKQGVKFCVYFSILDWHDPDYPVHNDGKAPDPAANMDRFRQRIKDELREIITRYNPYMLWFDGQWESPWTDEMGVDLYNYLKTLNKDLIINNRLGKEMTALYSREVDYSRMIGDYDTPEQQVGKFNLDFPWESCITIATQWAWKPGDKTKTTAECLQTLIRTASGNGNLLLNVGPMSDGRIEPEQVKVLEEMGAWLKKYGESIYGTQGGPYLPNETYSSTRKGNKVYIHLSPLHSDGLVLPAIPGVKALRATILHGKKITMEVTDEGYYLHVPEQLPDKLNNVIVLELDKPAMAKYVSVTY